VYVGAAGMVSDAFDAWEKNQLQAVTDENVCRQHAFREHDHGHGKTGD
jgi:hypothetical protein